MIPLQDNRSALLVTLDSCRFDTFQSAVAPNLKSIGRLYKAMAPGNFTYASHAAMFVGFTPGVAELAEPYVNPKFAKIFKMAGKGFAGGREFFSLTGRSIVDGFRREGYLTVGSGAVDWFDTATDTGRELSRDFEAFWFAGDTWSLQRQLDFVAGHVSSAAGRGQPVFAFLNVGETHLPYYHAGANWGREYPCLPFGRNNDAEECRRRQKACVEFVDQLLAPLVAAFAGATIVVCGDHGDAWGEDGLWEHGIHHPKVYEVPLIFRLGEGKHV